MAVVVAAVKRGRKNINEIERKRKITEAHRGIIKVSVKGLINQRNITRLVIQVTKKKIQRENQLLKTMNQPNLLKK